MNAHSFERRLRDLAAPAPDPQAQDRARHAALAEFARMHDVHEAAKPAEKPATRQPGGSKWFQWPRGPLVWGGMVTACMALVAVSLLWLTPADERAVRAPEVLIADEHRAEADAPTTISRPATVAPPVTAPPVVKLESLPKQAAPSRAERSAPAAVTVENEAPRLDELRQKAAGAGASTSTALSNVTDRPQPPAPATAALVASNALMEVQVTGSRVMREVPPSAQGPGRFGHFETNSLQRVTDEPVSTFSVDVDTASYSVVRRQINEGRLPPADAVRVEEMINYFDYAWPAPASRSQPFRASIAVSDSPWNEGRKLIHIGIKGFELPARERPDVNLVLLLDVSGSMSSPDKLPLAQQSVALLLDSLKPTDTVAIAVYAGAAGEVLAPTPVRDRETILRALYSLRPGGSTAGAAGIRLAYELAERSFRKEGVNRILLATDGDFNVGITDLEEMKSYVARERDKGVFLSVLGFGAGDYRDDMAQMLAQNGNGVAAYIDTAAEARKVLVQEASASLFTIARDVKLQMEFNPATVADYRLIGYETRALNEEDFNNDKVDAGDVGSGHAVTAIYEITPVGVKSASLDERRYSAEQKSVAAPRGKTTEYGYLKIRYKLPDSSRSRLIEQPVRVDAEVAAALRQDVAFSTAVAGFGQLLRDGRYTGEFTYDAVIRQAQSAMGKDPYGYRAEFVQLVRRAQAMEQGAPQR